LAFSLVSQLLTTTLTAVWFAPPVLIAVMLGASQVTSFNIGCKGPMAISWLSWNAAEVLFPVASASTDRRSSREDLIELGIRWNLIVILPWCLALWTLAPALLHAWLGTVDRDATVVARLMTVAILADSIGVPSLHVLWGLGATVKLFGVFVLCAMIELGLMLWLLPTIGVAGAAWAAIAAFSVSAVALIRIAGRTSAAALMTFRRAAGSLVLPFAGSAIIAALIVRFLEPDRLSSLVIASLGIAATSYGSMLVFGASGEERLLVNRFYRGISSNLSTLFGL
jgi:O-antigen/teichoic acid export membrane protein